MYDRTAQLSVLDSLLSDEDLDSFVQVAKEMVAYKLAPPKAGPPPVGETPEQEEAREAVEREREAHEWQLARGDRKALIEEMRLNKHNWATQFGRGALLSGKPVDQREVDRKRGYFEGARYYLEILPEYTEKRLMRAKRTEGGEA